MLSGRSETVKSKIGSECTKIIRKFLESSPQVQVSVEIRDMDRKNYFTTSQLWFKPIYVIQVKLRNLFDIDQEMLTWLPPKLGL